MMGIDLADYETRAREAVSLFWNSRLSAREKQEAKGSLDVGGRASVTSGKNMDGFVDLVKAVVVANGLTEDTVFCGTESIKTRRAVTIPGFYRPVKAWDLLVVQNNHLIAAFEFKSQVGPSFGNNFNNRCEEALGNASDFWIAYREGAFGDGPRPFLGYLMLLEDCPKSRKSVRAWSKHFSLFPEFEDTSYAARYEILCRKLVKESLYEAGCLLLSERKPGLQGSYSELSDATGLRRLVTGLAGHVAAAASGL